MKSYQQTPGSPLRGSVCKGIGGSVQCHLGFFEGDLQFRLGLCEQAQLFPFPDPISEQMKKEEGKIHVYT